MTQNPLLRPPAPLRAQGLPRAGGTIDRLREILKDPANDTSQFHETWRIILEVDPDDPALLAEAGASDGCGGSDALPLLLAGWGGLLVEPHPESFAQLEERYRGHPDVRCVRAACGSQPGTLPLYLGTDGNPDVSTLCTDDTPWFREHRGRHWLPVPVETLTRLLEDHGFPPRFALLLVDAEGMDKEVLDGLDFMRFRPGVIVTEEYGAAQAKQDAKHALLRANGYALREIAGVNEIWSDRAGTT